MNIPSEKIRSLIGSAKKIVITAHKNPDGDAVGSTLGFYHALKNAGIASQIILPDAFPSFLSWMPDSGKIRFYEKEKEFCENQILNCDLLFSLDYNSMSRTVEMEKVMLESKAPKVLIDHHPFPADEFDISYSDIRASSTSQMIVELLLAMEMKSNITAEAATCLYAGIVTDTGSFRFSSATPLTHNIAAILIEKGAENARIHNQLFDTNSESRLKLTGYALSEKMVVLKELKTAYIVITKEELKRFNYRKGDTEGLVNYGLSIEGIEVAAIFTEHDDIIKISFRSNGSIPVNKLSSENFEGGGHTNAAGGKSTIPLNETIEKFNKVLPDFIKKYA